jgi:putative MATE family efflux protein
MSSSSSTPESADRPHAGTSFWRDVAHALQGEQHDYTKEKLNRAILLLSVPMVLEMVMESLFAIVDVFWVSRLGRDAVAVIGLTESVMSLVYAVAIGISFGATAIVARRIGEKDPERAARSAAQIVMLGVTIAAGLGVVLGYFAPDILRLMGATPQIVELGSDFARIMLGGNVTVFMIFLINAIFRGAGDAVLAMRTLWLANAFNIVLGPFFIFGWGPFPEMGVTGAAVATNIGRGIGVLYQLRHLAGHNSRVRVRLHHYRPALEEMRTIVTTSGNGILQMLIATTSWIGLFKILSAFGSAAIAGYTIAIRIVVFALMPAWGLANAGATLVGQNLGAQRPDRAEAAVRIATRFNAIFLAIVGAVFVILAYPLAGVFTSDPETLTYAARGLWIVSLAFPLYAAGMCFEGAFNGAGDTWTPTRLNFFCFWLGQVPLAWALANIAGLGALGVFISVPVSFSVLALWSAVLFKRGKWKLQKV